MGLARYTCRGVCLLFILVLTNISLAGCTASTAITTSTATTASTPTPQTPRLRIKNSGTMAVENLTVYFPEDEINFGDIAASTTTEYQDVPNGVFGFAAFRFELDGQVSLQPVEDWVGEVPLQGNNFSYTIDFNPNRSPWGMVRLIDVSVDE